MFSIVCDGDCQIGSVRTCFYEWVMVRDKSGVEFAVKNVGFFVNCFDMEVAVESLIRYEMWNISDCVK